MDAWVRALRATIIAGAVVLGVIVLATLIGKVVEGQAVGFIAGHPVPGGMLFDKLQSNLITVTIVVLPVLFIALGLGLLERVRHIRLKLFTAYLVGQVVALIGAIVAAHNNHAMPIDSPQDGLFGVLLVYAATLSLTLAYLLAGSMTAALARIRAGAERIADGDLHTRIAVDSRDELGELADDLNAMATRLAAVAQQERRMEQSRRELIAAVSHDLRTPLAAIRATIEAIVDGVVTDEETIRRYLRTMHDGTRELNRLIDDLFDLSRIEAGALNLAPAPTALADLVSDTLERMRPQATARDVTLDGFAEANLPLVPLDARHIGRVLTNLVDNAIRHTPARGCVEVAVRRDDAGVRVDVLDTGEGITPADLPYLFERFYRGEKSRSREHGGAGLGLAISKGLVEAHGGSIWAESLHPHGARFSFTLPVDSARPAAGSTQRSHGPGVGVVPSDRSAALDALQPHGR